MHHDKGDIIMFQPGETVQKVTGDYRFTGTVCSAFHKRSGQLRYAVENDDGLLLILNEAQLRLFLPEQYVLFKDEGDRS
jgi:hypothetical protein